jgi:hypothetical protein
MNPPDVRLRLWTVGTLVAFGASGLALLRSFLGQVESLPSSWRGIALAGLWAVILAGTLLLLLVLCFWKRLGPRLLMAAVVAVGILVVLVPAVAKTCGRLALGSNRMVLDSVLQVEVAADFVAQGRNPYREDYFGTELEAWHGARERFPLRHLVYPPVPLLATLPFRAVSRGLFDAYDSRFILIPALAAAFLLCAKAWKSDPWRPLLLTLSFLNPLVLSDFHVGRWDTLILLGWVGACLAWTRGRPAGMAVLLGLLGGIKLTLLAGGVFGFLSAPQGRRERIRWAGAFGGAFLLPLVPFILWDAGALFEDLVAAPLGLGGHPARVIDAGPYGGGWVQRMLGGIPGWLVQVPATLGVGFVLGREAWDRRRPAAFGIATVVTLATFFTFGSYSEASYFGFFLSMAVAAIGFDRARGKGPAGSPSADGALPA